MIRSVGIPLLLENQAGPQGFCLEVDFNSAGLGLCRHGGTKGARHGVGGESRALHPPQGQWRNPSLHPWCCSEGGWSPGPPTGAEGGLSPASLCRGVLGLCSFTEAKNKTHLQTTTTPTPWARGSGQHSGSLTLAAGSDGHVGTTGTVR